MNINILRFFGIPMICILSVACVTTYQSQQPRSSITDKSMVPIQNSKSLYALESDVLSGRTNRIYAKKETENEVNLISLIIDNKEDTTLLIPNELIFFTNKGDTLKPLTHEEASLMLIDPVEMNDSSFVEAEGGISKIIKTGKIVNDAKRVLSHSRFIHDLQDHYLEDRILNSGASTSGFLVLPIAKGTPISISLH